MKKFFFSTLALAAVCAISQNAFGIQDDAKAEAKQIDQEATQANEQKLSTNQAVDGKIRFSFDEQEWQDVIPWFANQAGYSLQPISDWPQGTFTLKDDSEYTVLEALDQLNHALLIRPDEPYTLIRNRNMLVLWKTRDTNFPNDLIESVNVKDLDKRGKYETISCIFDVGDLNAEDMFDELKPMISDVHKNYFAVFPAANQLHIRETGGQLRDIRDLIEASQNRRSGQEITVQPYRLKNQDAETFMMLAGPMLGIPEGQSARADEDLAISVDPFGDRMFVRGTRKMLNKFDEIAALVDAKPEEIDGDVVINEPYVKAYAVYTDPKLAMDVLDTMMDGLDVKMDQDEITGTILVLGIKEIHEKIKKYLDAISDVESENFDIITLKHRDPAEVIVILQSMFRPGGEDSTEGPVLMAQSELYQILVRGTPQEVANVRSMVEQLDDNAMAVASGPRTDRRIIEMNENEQADIMPMIDDLLRANGRRNSLNIIMPEERKNIRTRIHESGPSLLDNVPQSQTQPIRNPQTNFREQGNRLLNKTGHFQNSLRQSTNEFAWVGATVLGVQPLALTGYLSPRQDEVGQTSDDVKQQKAATYKPAVQEESISGAPIEIRSTAYGIVLDSKDLDALDDLERAIFDRLGTESSVQLPQFFPLKHRFADEMLNFLQIYFGLEDAGGGDGGAGGMMQGMMNNMMGGGAGDLLGGLLGGGAGGGGDAMLEGDVKMGVDMRFNMVYVRGATGNDLEEIAILIDTLDRPDPPHEPELIGEFYTIDVNFRDPTELKTIIEQDMADLLDTGEQAQGGGQNAEAQQMMKMMAQLTGGGKRGGGSSADLEKEKPKGKLGVDPVTSKLLVTGPHHIYKQVLKRVELLDIPDPSPPIVEILDDVGDLKMLGSTLRAVLGNKIEIIDGATGEAIVPSESGSTASKASSSQANPAAQQQEAMKRMAEAMQARSQQGGGGTRGGGGGTRGGGGGTRGGGGGGGGGRTGRGR